MAFLKLGDKIDIRQYILTDRPALKVKVALPHFKALHGNASKTPGHWLPPTQWSDYFENVNEMPVTIFVIFKVLLE